MENNVSIANFNITFGKEEAPLLDYFENIIYPAFTSGLKREYKIKGSKSVDKFYFLNVKLIDAGDEDYFLSGHFVKETELEVKSLVINDELVKTHNSYPSAPYSVFYISLKNHRMILIKNQKGSPDLRSFGITTRSILSKYVTKFNEELSKNKEVEYKAIPIPVVNVIGIAMKENLEETLSRVTKINRLTLRFYPLNGDLDLTPVTESITNYIRIPAGSKTGNIALNSCENKKGVIDIIDGLQGVMEPSLNVDMEQSKGINIRNDTLSEKTTWNLDEDSINNPEVIIPKIKQVKNLTLVSESNLGIYNQFKGILKKYFK